MNKGTHTLVSTLVFMLFITLSTIVQAQDTLYIYPTKDATIDFIESGENFGDEELFVSEVIEETVKQSLIEFELDLVPTGAYVTSAKLTLYGLDHAIEEGTNESYLRRVTSSWSESTVRWDNKPSVTTADQVILSESSSSTQNYILDITIHVRDMLLNDNNYGFLMGLTEPVGTAAMRFASSDYGNSSLHPVLEIIYEIPDPIVLSPASLSINCSATNSGSIDLEVTGGIAPYVYDWEDDSEGSWSTQDLSGLSAGNYHITVTDALLVTKNTTVGIGYPVTSDAGSKYDWSTISNSALVQPCALLVGSAVKVSGTSDWENGELSSNRLSPSTGGWVEYTVEHDDQKAMFGMTEISSSDGTWETMMFGFYMNGSGSLIGIENGTQYETVLSDYKAGDVLRVTRSSSGVFFDKNGIEVHSVSNEAPFFDYSDELAVDINVYDAEGSMGGLRASFDNPIRVSTEYTPIAGTTATATITVYEDCYSGYSYTLTDQDENPYSSSAITGGVEFTGLNPGLYELEVSRSGYSSTRSFSYVVTDDDDYNWQSVHAYNDNEQLISASKTYYDGMGRILQEQSKDLVSNDIIASQTIYDRQGRSVLSTLPAPLFKSDFSYRPQFISDLGGDPYDYTAFDVIAVAPVLGDANNPKPVDKSTKGTVGWYYSNNNSTERYVPSTRFPYTMAEYSDILPGEIRRTSAPHDELRMGMGRESQSYTIPIAGELQYIYGLSEGWLIDNLQFISSSCEQLLNQNSEPVFEGYKTVSISPDGQEMVTFYGLDGKMVATAYSGKGDNAINVNSYAVTSYIPAGDLTQRYIDIHLPEGCETTLDLGDGTHDFYIQNLRTSTYESTSSTSTTTVNKGNVTLGNVPVIDVEHPTLSSGVYRIWMLDGDLNSPHPIKYDLNYYDFTLYYYDKAGNQVALVPPAGINQYLPAVTVSTTTHSDGFGYYTSAWGLGSGGNDELSISVSAPIEGTPNHHYELAIFLDNSSYIASDLKLEDMSISDYSSSGSSVSLATTLPEYTYAPSASIGSECGCSGDAKCITASDLTAAFSVAENFCDRGYPAVEYLSGTTYCLTCEENKQVFLERFTISFNLVNETGEGDEILRSGKMIATKYDDGWRFQKAGEKTTSIPGGYAYTLPLRYGETEPTIKLKVTDVIAEEPVLTGGSWDNFTTKAIDDYGHIDEITLTVKKVLYKHNATPQHKLYVLNDYNSKKELIAAESPDEGRKEYVYSKDGYLRFSMNAIQENSMGNDDKFSYTYYDDAGRIVESGQHKACDDYNYFLDYEDQYTGTGFTDVYEYVDDFDHRFSDINNCIEEDFHTLYDIPDPDFASEVDNNLDGLEDYVTTHGYCQQFVYGRASKTWNDHSQTWYSYDARGRLVWMLQKIKDYGATNATATKIKTTQYEYNAGGNLSKTIYQEEEIEEYFEQLYSYDANQRLIKVEAKAAEYNSGTSTWSLGSIKEHAEYKFYRHSPTKRIELGNDIQGIDFIYTTTGQLKAINSPNLGYTGCDKFEDPGKDGMGSSVFAEDVFGMTIDYFNVDYERSFTNVNSGAWYSSGNMNNWDEKIKSVRWNRAGQLATTDDHWIYTYAYNKKNWLAGAEFGTYEEACQNSRHPYCFASHYPFQFHASEANDYEVWNISYDGNGNILELDRNANETPNYMDRLTYNYNSCTNQLNHIDDTLTSAVTIDIEHQSTSNYTYDAIGQMTTDALGEVTVAYNTLGLVKSITNDDVGTDKKLDFEYNDRGQLLSMKVTDISGSPPTPATLETYWFINDADGKVMAYYRETHNSTPSLNTVQWLESAIYGNSPIGIYDPVGNEYYYGIKDHLGNVRAVVSRTKASGDADIEHYADYYPWGMKMPGMSGVGSAIYRHGYQGDYAFEEEVSGLDIFKSRTWDSRIARWTSYDPAGQFHSPYLGMANNPVSSVDPDGEFVPIIVGAAIGATVGYMNAKNAGMSDGEALVWMAAGAMVGGISGGAANAIATSGIAFANTAALAGGSLISSAGTFAYTNGSTDISVSFGAGSYNFSKKELGYIGKKGNSTMENFGYALGGTLANVSDLLAGFNPGEVQLNTENSDAIGHSALTKVGETDPNNSLVSVGPDPGGKWIFNPFKFKKGTNKWSNYVNKEKHVSKVIVKGVNVNKITRYGAKLNSGVKYNLYFSSCVNHTARALTLAGAPTIGIHPYILHAQMYLRSVGFRPMLNSYYLIQNNND